MPARKSYKDKLKLRLKQRDSSKKGFRQSNLQLKQKPRGRLLRQLKLRGLLMRLRLKDLLLRLLKPRLRDLLLN